LTRYCRSNNCHAFRLPRKGREKRHFNHLINAALQSSVYGHFIAALISVGTQQKWFRIVVIIQKNDVLCKLLPLEIRM
ncbi:MAG: hypothetical protein II885_04680, partial [Oscillospiraceae bacterium]|nr:hypothetical protein [Oscillospiraceae bacterium]